MYILRFLIVLLFTACLNLNLAAVASAHNYDLKKLETVSLAQMIADLQKVQVVFVGEHHDRLAHHQAQLQIIKALHETGAKITVGLEMFRQDGQAELDQWIEGGIHETKFLQIFKQHWQRWNLYRDIFVYARNEKIPMLGLNIPRQVINQVANKGFSSLSREQRSRLPLASCDISPEYKAFIRRAFGGHGDSDTNFEYFCEAQMLWDASMAKALADYIAIHPQRIIVVLAGKGHSWKHGIPEQLVRQGNYSYRVLLPTVPGAIDLQTIDFNDADYLLQGVEQGPLH